MYPIWFLYPPPPTTCLSFAKEDVAHLPLRQHGLNEVDYYHREEKKEKKRHKVASLWAPLLFDLRSLFLFHCTGKDPARHRPLSFSTQ